MRAAIEFVPYVDAAGEYRWRAVARNGRIVADSGEGYATEGNVLRSIDRFAHLVGTGEYRVRDLELTVDR